MMVLPPLPARISSPQLPERMSTLDLQHHTDIEATPLRQASRPLPNPPEFPGESSVSPFVCE